MKLRAFAPALALLGACSSTPAVAPPTWLDAPATLDVRQGIVKAVPMKLQADAAVKIVTKAPAGIEATVTDKVLSIRADYDTDGDQTVHVDLTDGGGTRGFDVVLHVAKLDWQKAITWGQEGPQEREHGAFFYDEGKNTAWLLQGSGYKPQFKPIDDDWKLDVSTGVWTAWVPTGDTMAPAGSRRTAHAEKNVFYTFGGYTDTADEGGVYRLDLDNAAKTVTKLTSVGAIPARELHAFEYDAVSQQLVVFGGVTSGGSVFGDTWLGKVAGDTVTWTEVKFAKGSAPTPRYGSFVGFDAVARRMVVFSGASVPKGSADPVNPQPDAWALDVAQDPPVWSLIDVPGAPPGRRNGCGVYDAAGRRLIVFGGTSDAATTQPGLFILEVTPGAERWSTFTRPAPGVARSSGFGFADAPSGNVYFGFGNGDTIYRDLNVIGYGP